jgi:hypothetical protein
LDRHEDTQSAENVGADEKCKYIHGEIPLFESPAVEDDHVSVVLNFLRSQSCPLAQRSQSPVFSASRSAAILGNELGRFGALQMSTRIE